MLEVSAVDQGEMAACPIQHIESVNLCPIGVICMPLNLGTDRFMHAWTQHPSRSLFQASHVYFVNFHRSIELVTSRPDLERCDMR